MLLQALSAEWEHRADAALLSSRRAGSHSPELSVNNDRLPTLWVKVGTAMPTPQAKPAIVLNITNARLQGLPRRLELHEPPAGADRRQPSCMAMSL